MTPEVKTRRSKSRLYLALAVGTQILSLPDGIYSISELPVGNEAVYWQGVPGILIVAFVLFLRGGRPCPRVTHNPARRIPGL